MSTEMTTRGLPHLMSFLPRCSIYRHCNLSSQDSRINRANRISILRCQPHERICWFIACMDSDLNDIPVCIYGYGLPFRVRDGIHGFESSVFLILNLTGESFDFGEVDRLIWIGRVFRLSFVVPTFRCRLFESSRPHPPAILDYRLRSIFRPAQRLELTGHRSRITQRLTRHTRLEYLSGCKRGTR